jgi:hypothetical protein
MRFRKTVEERKDIENKFYTIDSSNNDLENEIYKNSWRCSNKNAN